MLAVYHRAAGVAATSAVGAAVSVPAVRASSGAGEVDVAGANAMMASIAAPSRRRRAHSIGWRRPTTRSCRATRSGISACRRTRPSRAGSSRASACSRSAAAPASTRRSSPRIGASVVACDPSEEMLSRTKRRLANAGLGDRAGILSCGLQELPQFLDALDHAEGFDAIVSNFGALNCVPSLDAAGRDRPPSPAPGRRDDARTDGPHLLVGDAVLHRARRSRRRRRAGARRASRCRWPASTCRRSITGTATSHACARRGLHARCASIGIGVMVPPPYLEPRWQQLPIAHSPRRGRRRSIRRRAGRS